MHAIQRQLFGPGPTNVPDSVLQALAQPTIGHLDPEFLRIMDEVGRDSLSTVYLAKDLARNMVVVLEVIDPERAAEDQFRQRFGREARCLKQLSSTQAIKVFDYGEDEWK